MIKQNKSKQSKVFEKQKSDPYLIDTDKCVENIGNRFNMVLIASARARELRRGHAKKVPFNNSSTIIALREIEAGLVGPGYIRKI